MQNNRLKNSFYIHSPSIQTRQLIAGNPKFKKEGIDIKAFHQKIKNQFYENRYEKNAWIVQDSPCTSNRIHANERQSQKKGLQMSSSFSFFVQNQKLKSPKISKKLRIVSCKNNKGSPNKFFRHDQCNSSQDKSLRCLSLPDKTSHFTQKQIQKKSAQKSIINPLKFINKIKNLKFRHRSSISDEKAFQDMKIKKCELKIEAHRAKQNIQKFISGYIKGKQLGFGGFSTVWQAFNIQTKTCYAVKQMDKKDTFQTHINQIWFCNYFFKRGKPKFQYMHHRGIEALLRLHAYETTHQKVYLVYQKCTGSLSSLLYNIFQQGNQDDIQDSQKTYFIKTKPLLLQLQNSTQFLKQMILQIAMALDLFDQNKIVHSDIKTENILVIIAEGQPYKFKLIDYGCAFQFKDMKQYKLATPQYMCPQLINMVLFKTGHNYKKNMLGFVKQNQFSSAIDVWGLGCIILQLIHGVPVWMTNRTKIKTKQNWQTRQGIFSSNDRDFQQILTKQLKLVQNINQILQYQNNSQLALDGQLKDIIKQMLCLDPTKRIKPSEIINRLSTTPLLIF